MPAGHVLKQDAGVPSRPTSPVRRARRAGVAFAAALILTSASVHAQLTHAVPDAVTVGPSTCLDAPTLAARVEMWLGRSEIDARVSVRVRDERDVGQGVVFVVLREGRPVAERRLRPKSIPCPDLTAAVGIAIALAIDATFLASLMNVADLESIKAPPAPPAPPPPPSRPEPEKAPPSAAAPHKEAVGVRGSVQAHALVGVLPTPVAGASFGFDVALAPWADLRISGMGTLRRPIRIGTGEADVTLAAGRFDGCFVRPVDAVSLVGCGGVVTGRWIAAGSGYDVNQSSSLPWMAAVARAEGRLRVGEGIHVVFAVDGYVPLLRPVLDVRGRDGKVVASDEAPAAGFGVAVGPLIAFF